MNCNQKKNGNEKEEVHRKEENSNERKSCNCNEQSRNGEAEFEFQPKGEDATTWTGPALRDYDDFVLGIQIGGI